MSNGIGVSNSIIGVMNDLTGRARSALLSAQAPREGARLTDAGEVACAELGRAGLIGEKRGLTRRGVIVRDLLIEEALDAAF